MKKHVFIQGWGAVASLVVGLRVRAVRAGSIGREKPEPEEQAEDPRRRREALAPAPETKIPALMISSVTSGPEGQDAAWPFSQTPIRSKFPLNG